MPIDWYVGPRRRRPWRFLLPVAIILLLAELLAWQQGWQPNQALAYLSQDVWQHAPLPLPQLQVRPAKSKAGVVIRTNSIIIENPQSQAYTADLYTNSAESHTIPWPHVAGRTKVQTYMVQEGDTLWSIAAQFELDLDTLRWSNPALERNPDVLAIGTELIILPVPGVYHMVVEGDTLKSIATQYAVAEIAISHYPPNGLYPAHKLKTGQGLIVPFGRKGGSLPQPSLTSDSPLIWPLVGTVTGDFEPNHQAIDVGAPYGATIYATADGTVRYAGWGEDSLGYTVVIDHGEGLETWYVHLKGTLVQAGAFVARGNAVGAVGSTGHSSGPHVHFEVRLNSQPVNPLDYLPAGQPQ